MDISSQMVSGGGGQIQFEPKKPNEDQGEVISRDDNAGMDQIKVENTFEKEACEQQYQQTNGEQIND